MRAVRGIVSDHAAELLPALAFFAVAAALGARLHFLHDEGIFTFDLAAALPHALLPVLFLLKAKPLLMLLYAAPARAGLVAFLVTHAAVAAAAIVLSVGAARRLGLANPSLAGWTLATSLGFFVAAGSGFANSDGAFFVALFLWLWAGQRRTLAALVLGALPLVRYELAFIAAVFISYESWRRRDLRFALTALAFPVAYLVTGAVYHRDLFWLLHSLPNRTQPAHIQRYQPLRLAQLGTLVIASLAVNFSALGLVGVIGWDRRERRLRPIFIAVAVTYVLLIAIAGFELLAVDGSLRYHVAPLPLVALLAASWRGRTAWRASLVALQAIALIAALAGTDYGREQHLGDHRLMAAVRASRLWHGQPIYTDVQIARYDRCAGVDAWMIANDSIVYELDQLVGRNPAQRRALFAALAQQRFLMTPAPLRRDALYLFEASERGRRLRDEVEAAHATAVAIDGYRLYGWN